MTKILLIVFSVLLLVVVKAQPGTLNKNFGDNGILLTDSGNNIAGAVLKPDGRVLLNRGVGLIMHFADGKVDSSFGLNGKALFAPNDPNFAAYSISIQRDDKIVGAGFTLNDIALARCNSNGSPDVTFGNNGEVKTVLPGYENLFYSVCVLPDGRIVGAGKHIDYFNAPENPLVVCYKGNGQLDTSFGTNGVFVYKSGYGSLHSVIAQNGKILVGGGIAEGNSEASFLIMRLNTDGLLDSSFAENGLAISAIDEHQDKILTLLTQNDDKVLALGTDGNVPLNPNMSFGIIRFTEDGALDDSYGTGGKVSIKFGDYSAAVCGALQANDKLVVGGYGSGSDKDFALARLNNDGSLDTNFGDSGKVLTDMKPNDDMHSLVIQKNGNIMAIGNANANSQPVYYYVAFAQYLGDPITHITKATIIRWIKNHILHWQLQGVNNADVDYYVVETNKGQSVKLNDESTYDLSTLLEANVRQLTIRIKAVMKDGSVVYNDWIIDATIPTIAIYPNPVKDVLKVLGLKANQSATINILNRNGNVLASDKNVNGTTYLYNVSHLHSGIYYLQVIQNNQSQMVKFIKE